MAQPHHGDTALACDVFSDLFSPADLYPPAVAPAFPPMVSRPAVQILPPPIEVDASWNDPAHRLPAFQDCNASKQPPKFHPVAVLRPPTGPQVLEEWDSLPCGSSILIVQNPWLSLLLDGIKSLEIRSRRCAKPAGERIYLALSGAGGYVFGSVKFVACHGPLGREEWAGRSAEHCAAGAALPYPSTFAWEVSEPICFRRPVPYIHRHGTVVWAKVE
jgi:hypothetical protein